ncbi:MAG: KH domain-containing protein [Candidatus Bathyarchaeia archaeon]
MMYHTMVYSEDLAYEYTHSYAVHLFTERKLSAEEAFERAEELLDKHFPNWREKLQGGVLERVPLKLKYVGIEELPVEGPESYVAVYFWNDEGKWEDIHTEVVSTVPEELANAITSYRFSRLTLDYDEYKDSKSARVIKALNEIQEICDEIKVLRSAQGYHIRAPLRKPASFDELLKIREELGDDYDRRHIDKIYHNAGLDFLTNFLFNEKHWFEGKLVSYTERELSKEEVEAITAEYYFLAPETAPSGIKIEGEIGGRKYSMRIEEERKEGVFGEIVKKEAIVSGHITHDEAYSIYKSVAQEWERQQSIIDSVRKAYYELGWKFYSVLNSARIWIEGDTVFIEVPPEYMGKFIGKMGANVKYVEGKAGCKVRIVTEETVMKARESALKAKEETKKLKKRAEDLISQLLENEA